MRRTISIYSEPSDLEVKLMMRKLLWWYLVSLPLLGLRTVLQVLAVMLLLRWAGDSVSNAVAVATVIVWVVERPLYFYAARYVDAKA